MKKKVIITILVIGGFYAFLYYWNKEDKSIAEHPAIHSAAGKPDDYLLQAKDYEEKNRHDRSAVSIEKAIETIWKLEKDVDDASFEHLEQTITQLEIVHSRIVRDSIPKNELMASLEYALSNLAYAELQVAEEYSAANQLVEAKTALKYAQLHINNALLLHNPSESDDSMVVATEQQLLTKMDSLLKDHNLNNQEYFAALDTLLKEVDALILKIDE